MEFILPFSIRPAHHYLRHKDKVLLAGSCFTEHIGKYMSENKMNVLQNPHGVLFNPCSLAKSLQTCLTGYQYTREDLFFHQDLWQSWDFHSRFSHTDPLLALEQMNESVKSAGRFMGEAQWVILTLGSSFQYFITEPVSGGYRGVANCHKAPGSWFEKRLLGVAEMVDGLSEQLLRLQKINPGIRVILTVSPVRHTRDGIVENNRSKARLIEVVHTLTGMFGFCNYFPAYELVIDVLRDYRFYDADMTHPSRQAVQFVWEQFVNSYLSSEDHTLIREIGEIIRAFAHRPRFPGAATSKGFSESMLRKIELLRKKLPYTSWDAECRHFASMGE